MSQHDYNVSNSSGAVVRADLNLVLGAIASMNTGAIGALPTTFANMVVADTTSGHIAKRDNANASWDYLGPIDQRILASSAGISAYAITPSPAVSGYKDGAIYQFRADVAAAANPTLGISGLSAKNIKIYFNGALINGPANCVLANQIVRAQYNASLDCFIALNPVISNPGKILQVVNVKSGTYALGTTIIPWDNTIPQQTEGNEFMTLAITPAVATSKLRIEALLNFSVSTLGALTVALFRDGTANALVAVNQTISSGGTATMQIDFYTNATSISATTFKIRAGINVPGTVYFNGWNGSIFGGVFISSITITEIAA